jgi:hypothetical protein
MLVGDGWRCGIMRSDWHNGRNARANTCFARKRLIGRAGDTHLADSATAIGRSHRPNGLPPKGGLSLSTDTEN